jgi:hypothetical protein
MSGQTRWRVRWAGLVLLSIGLLGGVPAIRDVVYQAQGDYLSCVGPWTWPVIAGCGALVAIGAVMLFW